MAVRMNFGSSRKPQKRSKALKRASRTNKSLENELISIRKENKKLRNQNQRLSTSKNRSSGAKTGDQTEKLSSTNTPKSKANKEICQLGLTPRKISKGVKRKIVMANAMMSAIRIAREKEKSQKQRNVVANIVSGSILRKYKCLALVSKGTRISRSVLKSTITKTTATITKRRKVLEKERIQKRVVEFMETMSA